MHASHEKSDVWPRPEQMYFIVKNQNRIFEAHPSISKVIQNRLQFSFLVLRTGATTKRRLKRNWAMPTPRHKTERTNHNGFDNTKNGFRIPCKWNLDPRFQTLAGFRILWNEFQIPKPRISNSDSKNSRILKFRLPYMGPVNDFIGFCFKGLEYNEIYRINMLYFRDVHVLCC